ncbi:helix-turn-helix domain-containing protein [Pelodictyon luteolum]|nr:helix-turn-helix transcriptional regulator [Pelodictyon luteolum]
MDDLDRYTEKRGESSPDFARTFERGYEQFRIGELLRQVRIQAGLTQNDLAEKLHTRKSAVSRIENHSEDIRLSTLAHYAEALGKKLKVVIQ